MMQVNIKSSQIIFSCIALYNGNCNKGFFKCSLQYVDVDLSSQWMYYIPNSPSSPGGKHSIGCTLILTEGDSAKTLAVSGLGVIGRDRYGVFPLKGKMLNVREASHKQVSSYSESSSEYRYMLLLWGGGGISVLLVQQS